MAAVLLLPRRRALPLLGLAAGSLLVAVALSSCAGDSQDNGRSDGAPEATPTLTATELLAPQSVRDTFAELINLDASLLGETWTPDWTCDGIVRALRIEAGVVELAGAAAADNPDAARAQDSAFGTLLMLDDWLVENDCPRPEAEASAAPSTPEYRPPTFCKLVQNAWIAVQRVALHEDTSPGASARLSRMEAEIGQIGLDENFCEY